MVRLQKSPETRLPRLILGRCGEYPVEPIQHLDRRVADFFRRIVDDSDAVFAIEPGMPEGRRAACEYVRKMQQLSLRVA